MHELCLTSARSSTQTFACMLSSGLFCWSPTIPVDFQASLKDMCPPELYEMSASAIPACQALANDWDRAVSQGLQFSDQSQRASTLETSKIKMSTLFRWFELSSSSSNFPQRAQQTGVFTTLLWASRSRSPHYTHKTPYQLYCLNPNK